MKLSARLRLKLPHHGKKHRLITTSSLRSSKNNVTLPTINHQGVKYCLCKAIKIKVLLSAMVIICMKKKLHVVVHTQVKLSKWNKVNFDYMWHTYDIALKQPE